jgi:hypothetical protein
MTVHIIIGTISILMISILDFNTDYEYIILLLGQFIYPIATLLKMYPSRELLESNYYVVYLLNMYFNDIIPSTLYLLGALFYL